MPMIEWGHNTATIYDMHRRLKTDTDTAKSSPLCFRLTYHAFAFERLYIRLSFRCPADNHSASQASDRTFVFICGDDYGRRSINKRLLMVLSFGRMCIISVVMCSLAFFLSMRPRIKVIGQSHLRNPHEQRLAGPLKSLRIAVSTVLP